jgi:putative membrane-bound dehydrogenase-like protein
MRIGLLLLLICLQSRSPSATAQSTSPTSPDPRLEIRLVAAEPDIVTPVGAVFDAQGRLFVIESHTHFPKAGYTGPKHDVVKRFTDTDGDGVPDRMNVFAENFQAAMNLALSPAGEVVLTWRNGVFILHDRDGDGVSEARTAILEMESASDYPHNGIHGVAFGPDGWLYIGMGENMAARQVLKGTDGVQIRGVRGEGRIFRCRPDGTRLELFARGFWNPFGLEFDRAGRLFCVDNDPGGRPPCRLMHIIRGGNYGYQRIYDDLHPFNGWDGELPGSLPMITGTGEAPCGILDTDRLALPRGYQGALLVASWGDHAVELYRLKPDGASFTATKENLVTGDKQFNEAFTPVGLAPAPDGSLYITDWADRSSYPVHGKGRIWRLAAKKGSAVVRPRLDQPTNKLNKEEQRLERLLTADVTKQFSEVEAALADNDPFIRSAAVTSLARTFTEARALREAEPDIPDQNPRTRSHPTALRFITDSQAVVRLGALLAMRSSGSVIPEPQIRHALSDEDEQVRFLALWWAAEEQLTALTNDLAKAVAVNPSPSLFDAYLAAAEILSREPTPADNPPTKPTPSTRDRLLARILHDDAQPVALRAMAAATVSNPNEPKTAERLLAFARAGEHALRAQAVRTLAGCTNAAVAAVLVDVARDTRNPAGLRADALAALDIRVKESVPAVMGLLSDAEPVVQIEAARILRLVAGQPDVQRALRQQLAKERNGRSPVVEQLRFTLELGGAATEREKLARPSNREAWHKALAKGGDADSGRRVFFHHLVNCAKCHQVQGRGAMVGPDLTQVARSFDRAQLIDAILDPSRDVAPQYEQHIVETSSGAIYTAILVHTGLDGTLRLNAVDHGQVRVRGQDVLVHQTSLQSLMPAGLEQVMTVEDFRDLLAFLLGKQ